MADPGDPERREIMADLLRGAIPVTPVGGGQFVTHEQLRLAIGELEKRLETKLENAMLRTRNWVLGGIIASAVLFGGGFLTMMNKIDRMNEALPQLARVQAERRDFFPRQVQRDALQDSQLRKLDPSYAPMPYEPPPP